jgi:hypothetical protein
MAGIFCCIRALHRPVHRYQEHRRFNASFIIGQPGTAVEISQGA